MIELHISAGCSFSVWETKGGLQPRLESVPIPQEFMAKLEAWRKSYDSTCWQPLYSKRKEHDAKGRIIAAELQQAVGDKFHVTFRNWVEFDPKQWRSFWREENLFSGECKEFWINEDLPEEIATKVVSIAPDFEGAYLWDLDGCCIGNEGPAFPDDLDMRFTAWSEIWDACYDLDTMKLDKAKLAAEGFDEQGLALAAELKRAIGKAAKVIYCCILRKAALEVLEDGRTIEWPYETDFRQWALDHARQQPL